MLIKPSNLQITYLNEVRIIHTNLRITLLNEVRIKKTNLRSTKFYDYKMTSMTFNDYGCLMTAVFGCLLPLAACRFTLPTAAASCHRFPRAMPASALTTISPLEVIFFGENDVSFFCHVIIFRVKLVSKRHCTKYESILIYKLRMQN